LHLLLVVLWVLDILVKPIWIAGSFAIVEATTTHDASRKASSLHSQHRNYNIKYINNEILSRGLDVFVYFRYIRNLWM
jgi:hypothetical protein